MMELIHMNREKLAGLDAALPMQAFDPELAEIAAVAFAQAVYVNRSTWHVLTDHSRRVMLATEAETIPVLLVEIPDTEEIAAAMVYSGGINANLAGNPTPEGKLDLARYAWKLAHANERGRELLISMGAEPEYWLALFDYLTNQAQAEANESPAAAPTISIPTPQAEGFDIPMLDITGQPSRLDLLGLEFIAWGSQARNKALKATHFYTEDSRWKGIESKPEALQAAGVQLAIEANYSTRDDMPRVLVLADIYKKRRLAATWIGQGIQVVVDLNVCRSFFGDMLLGVPRGWKTYANRYEFSDTSHLFEAYELAKAHAGADIIYIVYGTSGAKHLCDANGWLYLDSMKSTGWDNEKALIIG